MKTKRITISLLFTFIISLGSAQLHPEYLDALGASLKFLEENIQPIGLSIAVKSGDDIWAGNIGVSSDTEPLNDNSLMAMGSISKTFVSACILSMLEEGQLSLQDPISKFLPTFENIDSTINVKQLLNHSSGIYNYTENPIFLEEVFSAFGATHNYTEEEVLEFVLQPYFEKGTSQEYSNTNYVLLGMIISNISEQPYYDEIIERFDLMDKLPSLSIAPFLTAPYDLSNLWADLGQDLEDIEKYGLPLNGLFSSAGAAGAFISNATDLATWGSNLYSGELLGQEGMDALFDYFYFDPNEKFGYGAGVIGYETECGAFTVGHGGNIIYSADLQYVKEYDLAIAVMTNDGSGLEEIDGVGTITQELICQFESTIPLATTDFENTFNVEIFPNPTTSNVTVSIKTKDSTNITYKLLNSLGQEIAKGVCTVGKHSDFNLDFFEHLEVGFYYLEISEGHKTITKTIVKT